MAQLKKGDPVGTKKSLEMAFRLSPDFPGSDEAQAALNSHWGSLGHSFSCLSLFLFYSDIGKRKCSNRLQQSPDVIFFRWFAGIFNHRFNIFSHFLVTTVQMMVYRWKWNAATTYPPSYFPLPRELIISPKEKRIPLLTRQFSIFLYLCVHYIPESNLFS